MPGRALRRLYLLAEDQHGFFTARDAAANDVTHGALTKMAARGQIEQVHRGVYRLMNFPVSANDQYVAATLWPVGAQGVLSHESALDLLDLGDVNPSRIHITVPKSHRVRRTVPPLYVVHRANLRPEESVTFDGILVTLPSRAIEDALSNGLRDDLAMQAIDVARNRGYISEDEQRRLRKLVSSRRPAPR